MSVNPGFGGQSFIPHALEKLTRGAQADRRRDAAHRARDPARGRRRREGRQHPRDRGGRRRHVRRGQRDLRRARTIARRSRRCAPSSPLLDSALRCRARRARVRRRRGRVRPRRHAARHDPRPRRRGERAAGRTGAPPLPKATIRDLVGKGIEHLLRRALALVGAPPRDADDVRRARSRATRRFTASCSAGESRLFPGVRDGLDAACGPPGFGSPWSPTRRRASCAPHLERAGIAADFDAVVGGDDAVRKKPDAAPLDAARGASARRARTPAHGGRLGQRRGIGPGAGCPVLVVPYGYREGLPVQKLGADGIVDSLVALAQCVAARRERPRHPHDTRPDSDPADPPRSRGGGARASGAGGATLILRVRRRAHAFPSDVRFKSFQVAA